MISEPDARGVTAVANSVIDRAAEVTGDERVNRAAGIARYARAVREAIAAGIDIAARFGIEVIVVSLAQSAIALCRPEVLLRGILGV